jgi:hypothetical protein
VCGGRFSPSIVAVDGGKITPPQTPLRQQGGAFLTLRKTIMENSVAQLEARRVYTCTVFLDFQIYGVRGEMRIYGVNKSGA